MNYDEAQEKEKLTWQREYVYKCLGGCGKNRKTRNRKAAEGRLCNACKRRKMAEAFDKRQIALFS